MIFLTYIFLEYLHCQSNIFFMIFPQLQHRLYLFLIVWSGVEKVKMEILITKKLKLENV